MPRHERPRPSSSHTRASIASLAARLMVEDGIADFYLAKRKAARQLGLPEHTTFPDNAEVELELRAYRSLYGDAADAELLRAQRRVALEILLLFADFCPYLTGSVLDGTAGEHSTIDILLFADSAKEVEIFLLNRGIDFEHVEPRNERVEAVLVLETDVADVNLIVLPPKYERVTLKHRDGRSRERIKADALRALLSE
ncbi:hypothetical protein GBK02_00725 [Dechloromonas sp. TW-R-39-2]|uniref:hypothetical protein n=1 Tax=Dechloromonas sp. TW-R-39-2 TaxID=2654218 RepID=UPI00193EAC7F|nr:hypothetical protein [Dechloromonas sp. TW-R-39-2]QRM18016.1 hypothetical protein GBK02_00725 [Dechloromonas sp. TW-R-39-2]